MITIDYRRNLPKELCSFNEKRLYAFVIPEDNDTVVYLLHGESVIFNNNDEVMCLKLSDDNWFGRPHEQGFVKLNKFLTVLEVNFHIQVSG